MGNGRTTSSLEDLLEQAWTKGNGSAVQFWSSRQVSSNETPRVVSASCVVHINIVNEHLPGAGRGQNRRTRQDELHECLGTCWLTRRVISMLTLNPIQSRYSAYYSVPFCIAAQDSGLESSERDAQNSIPPALGSKEFEDVLIHGTRPNDTGNIPVTEWISCLVPSEQM